MKKYMGPYLAGFGLGCVLLVAFLLYGKGLGASGCIMRTVVSVEKLISPEHTASNPYLVQYGGAPGVNPFWNYIVIEVLGVILGGVLSGWYSGRIQKETNHGPRITARQRMAFAFIGGTLFGVGARFARGCTSGVALTGGATLVAGSWITMLTMFAAAYATAWFARKLWI